MVYLLRLFIPLFTVLSVFFDSVFFPSKVEAPFGDPAISVLEYPAQAVMTLEQAGITEKELIQRDSKSLPEYIQSKGYDDVNGLIVSPYYTASIGELCVPVYAAMIHAYKEKKGGLHSFSEVYVDTDEPFSFNFELKGDTASIRNAVVLPQSLGMKALCRRNTMTVSITETGIYTFLFNGAKQARGFTLFVREKVDDDAEIASYVSQFGEENVRVFDKGVHLIDYLHFDGADGKVLYLRRGAYLMAAHHFDILSDEDDAFYEEEGARLSNAIGFTRYPFINFYRSKNLIIAGHGAIDMTRLDRHERRGVLFTDCDNISVRGVKIVNAPEWSLTTYCCHNVSVENVDVFGYRGNSDAFAICNTQNAVIDGCFARSADDLFEVKTLRGYMGSDKIVFKNCIAWGGYARCFGITGEVCEAITDVTFCDCAIIWRDADWDNDLIGGLVVVGVETEGSIDGVTFENIEVFRDEGRAICVKVYDDKAEGFSMKNIVFRNIRCVSYRHAQVADNELTANSVEVEFDNVNINDLRLSDTFIGQLMLDTDGNCAVGYK